MRSAPLEVIDKQPALWGCWLTVYAHQDDASRWGSVLGDREFYLDRGRELTFRAVKHAPGVGRRIDMDDVVGLAKQWANLPWDWA